MSEFNNLIVSVIYLAFPLICYFFYLLSKHKSYGEEKDLILELALYTSMYLVIKVSPTVFNIIPFFLCNVPLLIAYMRKKPICILIISIIITTYMSYYYHESLLLVGAEYAFYYILYATLPKSKYKSYLFAVLICVTKLLLRFNIVNLTFILVYLVISFITIYTHDNVEDVVSLNETLNELDKDKSVRDSLFTVTHEIKNPLAVCKGYLEMYDQHPEEKDRYIKIVKSEVERTLVILDDFMNLSKIKIHKEEMDVNLLLEDLIDSTKLMCENNHIKVVKKLVDDELYINADYNRLKQVLVNIVKNSVEACHDDGLITIANKKASGYVLISISDNGIGMDTVTLAKLGDAYFTTKNHGTGIGVRFSKEIISGHDGFIKYDSKLNKGTKVTIKLPMENY